MPEEQDPEKKIDLGWKEQARREKERLAEELDKPSADEGGPEGGDLGEMPEADFMHFVSGLSVQVMMFLGQIENPMIGKRMLDLPAAKYNIDILGILAEKTKGNLTAEEEQSMTSLLSELRMRYVQTVKALEKAMAEAPPPSGEAGGCIHSLGGALG
jgi:hypothetical protein